MAADGSFLSAEFVHPGARFVLRIRPLVDRGLTGGAPSGKNVWPLGLNVS
jgi:hypothetical protein